MILTCKIYNSKSQALDLKTGLKIKKKILHTTTFFGSVHFEQFPGDKIRALEVQAKAESPQSLHLLFFGIVKQLIS